MLQLTQEQVSELAKVPRSAIIEFEAGERKPRPSTLQKLRAALEVVGATFVDGEDSSGVIVRRAGE